MFKTHEKSQFEILSGNTIEKPGRIIVQIGEDKLYTNSHGMAVFLCETVEPEEFNRTTLEGRLEDLQSEYNSECEAHAIETEEAMAKIDAMEELLAQERDSKREINASMDRVIEDNKALYNALQECRRIFGNLPQEIEKLLEGELDNVYTGTV